MKVKELIAKLQELDPEMSVMVSCGYESGLESLRSIECANLVLDYSGFECEEECKVIERELERAKKEGYPYIIIKGCVLRGQESWEKLEKII